MKREFFSLIYLLRIFLCLVHNGVLGRSTFLELVSVGNPRFSDKDGEKNPEQETHKGQSTMMETFGMEK